MPNESVIITVQEADTIHVCRECSQRVGEPHVLGCSVAYRNQSMPRLAPVAGHTYRDVQHRLCELYGSAHYYSTTYVKHEYSYHAAIVAWMGEYTRSRALPGLGDVLDIGAAYGTLACFASALGARTVTVLDKIPYMNDAVALEFSISRASGDIERLIPLRSASFNTIILTEVLEHFNFHPVPTMRRIVKALRPGGHLLLSTPDQASWGKITKYADSITKLPIFHHYDARPESEWVDGHIWQYSKDDLYWLLRRCDLKVVECTKTRSDGGEHFNVICTV